MPSPSSTAARVLALALVLSSPAAAQGRVIVLGFDGADARTVEAMMDRGELPNLARLREQGTFAPLASTVPCESPVSWASLNSGQNPAKTGIQGFVKRSIGPSGPYPDLGLRTIEGRATDTFELGPLARALSFAEPPVVAAVLGAAVLVAFLLVFFVLLRIKSRISVAIALLLGAIGAWGGYVCAGYVPERIDDIAGNPNRAGGFWETAARAGVECIALDAGMAWDRPAVEGARVLAGLGVPDIRGENGDWFVYTTDEAETARAPGGRPTSTAGTVFRVDESDGRIDSAVFGPVNHWRVDALRREAESAQDARRKGELERELAAARRERLSLPLVVERKADGPARVSIGGQVQEVAEGAWSDWYHLSFELNPLIKAKAITRVKVVRMEPFELYVNILQIDPTHPPFWQPISQPASFASELAGRLGDPYETVGWACLTMPYKDEEIDEATFLEGIEFTFAWREKLALACLGRDDWRAFFAVEGTVDRVQHMMYQYYDPSHPLFDAAMAERTVEYFGETTRLADVIPATYRRIDRFVGRVIDEHLKPDDTLILCADHGFQSFRRQVNINNWLAEKGYLAIDPRLASKVKLSGDDRRMLAFVDWGKTKAYSLGLGMIFLNLQGREPFGIVAPEDAPAVTESIRSELLATKDGDVPAVAEVYATAELHHGPFLGDEADIMPGFAAGYRVSWRSTLGGIQLVRDEASSTWVAGPNLVFEDNKEPWSGDHVSMARSLVRGIFFCNRRVAVPEKGLDLLDIAPTALAALGVSVPPDLDHPPLRFAE